MSYVTGKSPTTLTPGNDNLSAGVGAKAWRLVGWQFSAVESEIYPFDAKVVKAIREVDPAFVPIVIRSVYGANTGGFKHFEHHAIAWALSDPRKRHKSRRVLWPTTPGAVNLHKSGATLFLEDIMRGPDMDNGLPGPFQAIGWGTYHRIKAAVKYNAEAPSVEEEIRQLENREETKRLKEEKRLRDEVDYRIDHNERQLKAALEADNTPEGLRTLGMARPHEPKPHVFVGGPS